MKYMSGLGRKIIYFSGARDVKCICLFVCVETSPFPQLRLVTYTWTRSDEH